MVRKEMKKNWLGLFGTILIIPFIVQTAAASTISDFLTLKGRPSHPLGKGLILKGRPSHPLGKGLRQRAADERLAGKGFGEEESFLDPALGVEIIPGFFVLEDVVMQTLQKIYTEEQLRDMRLVKIKEEDYSRFLELIKNEDPDLYSRIMDKTEEGRNRLNRAFPLWGPKLVLKSKQDVIADIREFLAELSGFARAAVLDTLAKEHHVEHRALSISREDVEHYLNTGIVADDFEGQALEIAADKKHLRQIWEGVQEKTDELYQEAFVKLERYLAKGAQPTPETTRQPLSAEELDTVSLILQRDIIKMIMEGPTKSGHPGGSLSMIDIVTALYFGGQMRYDPSNPEWQNRDRFVLSKGHAAPGLYVTLAELEFFRKKELKTFRGLGSILQGHPDMTRTPGVDMSTGSLALGFSTAVGMAAAAKMDDRDNKVFCIIGDGEAQEGQISEAAEHAGRLGLDNLIAFIDYNKMEIDGSIFDVSKTDQVKNWGSRGWNVIEVKDGHSVKEIMAAINEAKREKMRPTVIIANTIKGRNLPGMATHGGYPKPEEANKALGQIEEKLAKGGINNDADMETFIEGVRDRVMLYKAEILDIDLQNEERVKRRREIVSEKAAAAKDKIVPSSAYSGRKIPTREANGDELVAIGTEDPNSVVLCADLRDSINLGNFAAAFGTFDLSKDPLGRYYGVGIKEGHMASFAAGLAVEGRIPVVATYDMFTARMFDQVRAILKPKIPLIILGAHRGLATGPDADTHMGTHMIGAFAQLPANVQIYEAADAEEQRVITRLAYENATRDGGVHYIGLTRPPTPVFEKPEGWEVGARQGFYTIYDTSKGEPEDLVIVAMGTIMQHAIGAAERLSNLGKKVKVINVTQLLEVVNQENGNLEKFAKLIENAKQVITVADALSHILEDKVNKVIVTKHLHGIKKVSALGVPGLGEGGKPEDLYEKYGLDVAGITKSALLTMGMLMPVPERPIPHIESSI